MTSLVIMIYFIAVIWAGFIYQTSVFIDDSEFDDERDYFKVIRFFSSLSLGLFVYTMLIILL